ncbi:MAG TPA: hypothetical protein VKS82_25540 [Streptosporangiaceae bacterium]|nr:hypothetical protein [Streptosporangiaceae bacterium]
MEILLAVAVATVAVAGWFTSTTFRTKIRENAAQLEQVTQRVQQAEKQLKAQSEASGENANGLADLKNKAELQLSGVARDIAHLDRHVRDLGQFVRARLDHEVETTRRDREYRVLVGGIHTERPTASGSLPSLFDSFLAELPVEMLFHDSADQFGIRCYLAWTSPNGQALEQRLDTLLRGCPDESGEPVPGLGELRALLVALHGAGPGMLQLGPLVAVRWRDGFAGAVLDPGQEGQLGDEVLAAAPGDTAAKLKELPGLVDLADWAQE